MNEHARESLGDPIGRGYGLGVDDTLESFKALAEAEKKSGDGRALRLFERYEPQVRSRLEVPK